MKKLIQTAIAVMCFIGLFSAFQAGAVYYLRPYAESKTVKIIDHVVYRDCGDHFVVEDFFDTEKAVESVKKIKVRETVNGKPVTEIRTDEVVDGYNCAGQPGLSVAATSISLPKTIRVIGCGAFSGFKNVKSLKIPESVEVIERSAFELMKSLESIVLPSKVTTVTYRMFNGCTGLKKVAFKGKITEIQGDAFELCTSLKTITLPPSLKKIGAAAFYGSGLESVTIPKGCDLGRDAELEEHIGVFENCKNLKKVIFAQRDKKSSVNVPEGAFRNCTALQSVAFPKNAKKIYVGAEAFDGCKKLMEVVLESADANSTKSLVSKLPKSCVVYVQSAAMKKTVKSQGFKGRIVIRADVADVKSVKASQKTDSVTLKWSKVKNADGYRVYVYNKNTKKFDKIADTAKTTYTVKKLKAGKAYTFAVRAYRKIDGDVSWSGTYTKLITAAKPATPKLTVKAGAKKAALTWNKQNCTGYQIYCATKKDGKFTKLATVKNARTVKYTAKSLKTGQTVYFKVRAYKAVGGTNVFGAFSAVKGVKIK